MTTLHNDPLETQSAVLHAAGLGIQAILGDLDAARKQLAARADRATANLDQLDRMMLRLFDLIEDLNERGGKVSATKLAAKLDAIRDGVA